MHPARAALPLLFGWLPIAVLFTVLIVTAHGGPVLPAVGVALRMVVTAALLGAVVHRLTLRWPWPHPFRLRFLALHAAAAATFAVAWFVLQSVVASLIHGRLAIVVGPGQGPWPYLILGVWLYVMVAGIAYASRATARAAELEALAAQTQLATLRAQLHPHFLFNALHTVVQLIPLDPPAAARAAEQLGEALRIAIDERRELVPLRDELAFVERYLALESIRFGPRLQVRYAIDEAARDAALPSFALQTLVENAVRHGAAPAVDATSIAISARRDGAQLVVSVDDDGAGAEPAVLRDAPGSGLRRLRERLARLHGDAARLEHESAGRRGVRATLYLPFRLATDAAS
ncbi:MAG TPA: histidine kinase [Xanthomonadales bacterium]|nr:histidine kinase [Xanthomonadales bacterium]